VNITLMAFDIELAPGWGVGTVTVDDPVVDRDLLLDAAGQPWVPGSALAGSLRAHLREVDEADGTDLETRLMGSRPPAGRHEKTTASRLWLLGSRFRPGGTGLETEVAGQTAIDRVRSAAAATSLRHSRTVSSGGTLTAYARCEGDLSAEELAVLARWRPAVGRGRSTGGGVARLDRLRHGTVDPADPAGRMIWLTNTGPDLVDAVATASLRGSPADQAWLSVELSIEDALLVGDPRPTGPARPRLRNGHPVVPGTAWKGLFRSRVEYILRSRYGQTAVCANGCGGCVTCDLFGHQGARGRLAFRDSPVEASTIPPERTQVGIDRVTGGAHDRLLFPTRPVTQGRLRLRVDTLAPVDGWVRPALLHVLRDLHDRLIGLGSRVTRGMGTVRLTDPDTDLAGLQPVRVPSLEGRAIVREKEAGDD
jgi:CRISPR/Cas system CSM-associated protein Csm3 (group 7 of RAMP superfamily)